MDDGCRQAAGSGQDITHREGGTRGTCEEIEKGFIYIRRVGAMDDGCRQAGSRQDITHREGQGARVRR